MKNTNTQARTLTLTPDELSTLIANAVAQALASTGVQAPVQARTHAVAPVAAPVQAHTYEDATEGFDNFVVEADKKIVRAYTGDAYTYTSARGNACKVKENSPLAFGRQDVWDAFKARMRQAGGTYDAQAKVWAFPSAKAAKAFAEGEGAKAITAEELNEVHAKWARKAEKRAQKGA